MEVSSVQQLCEHLISCAIQRCRMSDHLCRLSVLLKYSPSSDPTLVRISVSDTGVGSCLEEFQCLKYAVDPASAEKWDGVLSLTTTNITDDEIYQYHLNLKENVPTRSLTKLPSSSKNGATFSGTEMNLSIFGSVDALLMKLTHFLGKTVILKIPNVVIELAVECGDIPGSRCEKIVPAKECSVLSSAASNIERLKSGLKEYVFKHGNSSSDICHSCFSDGVHLKVGSGVACCTESHRNSGQKMEAVIIINEVSNPTTPSCFRACDAKTEVLYFKDFSPCSISQSALNGLTSIDWKNYGLSLRSIADQDGYIFLEWENLPANTHVDLVLHCYHKEVMLPSTLHKTRLERTITRKAVKLALNDLKDRNTGALLSSHAIKICSYAPDLARTIAGLVLSSNDSLFQGECLSLLGLQPQEIGGRIVEDCINEKIISAIEINDRKPQTKREAAPFLFEDDFNLEPYVDDDEYKGKEVFSALDL
ncbi:type 2 DNA topoisomerase 6 subunit B-like [Rhododendron vialii]|uniref:type 2 DNA topoisomerase 6 subunit B-like n=1 Tax=Rhododendron vialii TaxID=182163 RepID=UPI00265DE6C4|nr:type 2 DNA topoisomerase 6 subunit B-like [Rhododendron vialii]